MSKQLILAVLLISLLIFGCTSQQTTQPQPQTPSNNTVQTAKTQNSALDYSIMDAAIAGDYNSTKTLITEGANVNAIDDRHEYRNRTDESVLIYAIENGHDDVAKLLVENGADVNLGVEQFSTSSTPLFFAVANGDSDMTSYLSPKARIPM